MLPLPWQYTSYEELTLEQQQDITKAALEWAKEYQDGNMYRVYVERAHEEFNSKLKSILQKNDKELHDT